MPRPSEEDKLSDNELATLKEVVSRGIAIHGSAKAFAAAAGVRPPVISQARHGRLVARTDITQRILNFPFEGGGVGLPQDNVRPLRISHSREIAAVIDALTGPTEAGQQRLVRFLRAAAGLVRTRD